MTLTADVVADLHAADDALADLDPDSDVGFFSMSPASADQVTVQLHVHRLGVLAIHTGRTAHPVVPLGAIMMRP